MQINRLDKTTKFCIALLLIYVFLESNTFSVFPWEFSWSWNNEDFKLSVLDFSDSIIALVVTGVLLALLVTGTWLVLIFACAVLAIVVGGIVSPILIPIVIVLAIIGIAAKRKR